MEHSMAYVAMDTHKKPIAVSIVDGGRRGEVRYIGEISSEPATVAKMVAKLAVRHENLSFRYEAGPYGYGLYRQITQLGLSTEPRIWPPLLPHRRLLPS